LGVLTLCETGEVELISSEALVFEVARNPHTQRKEYALAVLSKASSFITLNEHVEGRAREFNSLGMKPLDALHLASAEAAGADFFCTCDDRFLKMAKAVKDLGTTVVSPVELITEIEQ